MLKPSLIMYCKAYEDENEGIQHRTVWPHIRSEQSDEMRLLGYTYTHKV